MGAAATATYRWTEDQALEVEVTTDAAHPDILDDLVHRVVWLLKDSLAAINEQPAKDET